MNESKLKDNFQLFKQKFEKLIKAFVSQLYNYLQILRKYMQSLIDMIPELYSSDLTDIIKDSILYKLNLKSESELKYLERYCTRKYLEIIWDYMQFLA